ncbi:MAG: hypothetical protein QOK00_528 [Thermoleophilaceae bacterium]|jgi:hypothetical protein|nr:hypothetical protein [Thermoleophilaceae bacterium]MEA2400125.1 hypothetical protein [Thermoleophilaceae bacterium]MEA2455150.1 hypothetical protein [Thermoleophilaceae bacterium]
MKAASQKALFELSAPAPSALARNAWPLLNLGFPRNS